MMKVAMCKASMHVENDGNEMKVGWVNGMGETTMGSVEWIV